MSDQIPQIGQRALAAIVFTDVVKFSSLASEDEQHALELMERDIKVMEEIVPKHEGIVLKKLGDGLLIYFSSAVQAVTCAEDIQRAFAENSILYPPAERMQHRIGIHLGDVFIKENDVMGDGVNVAARLQAEAEPNGICISQTVYDVVKNQLALQTAYLGQKDLKNIKNPVPVYRILVSGNEHAESSELNGSSSSWLQSNWKLIAALV
jgi:class 3 adenylate cyclase